MSEKVLKFAYEIANGDIIVKDSKRYVIISTYVDKEQKSVQLEVRAEDDAFDISNFFYDLKDPFIILSGAAGATGIGD